MVFNVYFDTGKGVSEYISESYFDYLSQLKDLIILMDELHRYRASVGVRAINEFEPIARLRSHRSSSMSPEAIERLKLEDGIYLHENIKAELETYSIATG